MKTSLRHNRCVPAALLTAALVVCFSLFQVHSAQAQCQISFPNQPENQNINCGDALPVTPACEAFSTCCDGPVVVTSFESQTGSILDDCSITTAVGPGPDWAFWLPDLQGISVAWNFVGEAHLQTYADGTAHLWGIIANASNPSLTFNAEMWFANARDWSQWSALGRSYKDDFGISGSEHLNWTYFELAEGFATLTGTGELEGSYLHLHHKPANYFYGFQLGLAANNKNTNPGFSGWFTYDGIFDGEEVAGHGDVNVDKACTTDSGDCGSTAYTHICRADDACGNFAFSEYTISVIDNTPPVVNPFDAVISIDCLANEGIFITATDDCSEFTITYTDEIIEEGCGGQLIRHYTLTDGCGNQSFADQTINLIGEQEPEFTIFPIDITIECNLVDDLEMPDVEWINGCGNTNLNITSIEIPGSCANSYQIIYTYTLTDACDNLVSQNWTINVTDSSAPELFNIPADITINCGDEIAGNNVFSLDNCDENPNVTLEAVTNQLACGYEFIRTWTATDACGNTISGSQTITVLDNVSPVFDFVPTTLNVNCGDEFDIEDAIASDACSPMELTWIDQNIGDCAGSFTRVWTAVDGCGNESVETTSVNITDTEAPVVLNAPENVTVNCDEVPTTESANLEFSDNCGSVTVEFFEDIFEGDQCPGSYSISRLWILTDECGNRTDYVWNINVSDISEPVIFGVPADQTLNCGDDVAEAVVFAIDNCDDEVNVVLTATTEPNDCGYNFIRTWTATDDCGNTSTATQTISFTDNEVPVFTYVPADVNLACTSDFNLDDLELAIATDDCSNVVVTHIDTPLGGNCGDGLLRTFTATDACGNTINAEQFISFSDEVDPIFTFIPANIIAECGSTISLDDAIATDNCSGVTITFNDVPSGGCAGSFIRTYTATDGCGNTATAQTSVLFTDDIAPVVTNAPADVTVNCNEVPTIESAQLQYTDNCGSVTVEFSENIIDGIGECPGSYLITRTWILTDECGNSSDFVWSINVSDISAPTLIGVPDNETLSCGDESAEAVVVAIDNCDDEVNVVLTATTEQNDCGYDFIRTWTATDDCGNIATATQTISFTDNEAPVFTFVPESVNLACSSNVSLDDLELATATDDCSSVEVTFVDTPLGGNCGDGLLRTFTATDGCGNSVNAEQFISFTDEVAPVFTFVPQNIVAECGSTISLDDAIATDNCSGVTITFSDVPAGGCAGSFIRTFTAIDGCGNTATAQTSVLFTDDEAPIITNGPADVTVNCNEVPTIESAEIEYTDNCGSVSFEFFEDIFEGVGECPGSYLITRLWILTDECGNRTDFLWSINVSDITAPTLVGVPANQSLSCGDEPAEAVVFAIDNCDAEVNVVLSATTIQNECGYNFIRTWTATDDCGNTTTASQTIEFTDEVAPFFTYVPAASTLVCSDNGGIPTTDLALADDLCSNVTVTYEDVPSALGCVGGISRNWTATDACGNTATATTTYTIQDEVAPQFILFPEDVTVLNCIDIPTIESAVITYEDNCSSVTIDFNENIIELDCANSNIIERTWTITDACGNSTSATWTIFALDEQAPQIFGVPADITVGCGEEVEDVQIFATDNCTASENLVIALEAETIQQPCGHIFRRTWTVTDECGNSTSAVQEITVIDELPPVFATYPTTLNATCGIPYTLEAPIAIDACSDVTYSVTEEILPGCIEGIIRTTTATDGCGNSATAVQTITISDTQAPIPSILPIDINTTCENVPVIAENSITFTDVCSDVTVTFTSEIIPGSCSNDYEVVYQWIAEDACGNTTELQQSVFVTPAQLGMTDLPDDLIISCSDPIPAPDYPTVTGGCNANIPVNLESTTVPGSCPGSYILLRRFYIEDDCDGTYTHIQLIQVIDNQPPVFNAYEPQISLPCSQSSGVFVVATDACNSVQVTYNDQQIGAGCGGTIQRTYTATDLCGNSATAVQFIQLVDTEAPQVISFPTDISVECSNIPSIANANIVAIDNCSNVFIESSEEIIEGSCANSYTILRNFFIEDLCGNAVERTWIITVSDTQAPEIIGVPQDITIDCSDDIPSVNPIAIDNCSAFPALSLEATTIDLPCGYQFIRTWTAIDECGNTTIATQVVTVSDFNAPELSEYPAALVLNCGETVPDAPEITAFDTCQGELEVTFEETSIGAGPCSAITRTWCVSDCAGNETCHTQTITFNSAFQQVNTVEKDQTYLVAYRSSRDQITINSNVGKSGQWRLDIYDITGRLVQPVYSGYLEADVTMPFTVDPSQFSDELYFIRLTNGETMVTQKMAIVD